VIALPSLKIIANRKAEQITQQAANNVGKLQIYRVQEVESLRRVASLQIIIESLQVEKKREIETNLSGLTGEEMQAELNKYFNNQ
jgi:post-segregation antitoxin (ccd killing protein)